MDGWELLDLSQLAAGKKINLPRRRVKIYQVKLLPSEVTTAFGKSKSNALRGYSKVFFDGNNSVNFLNSSPRYCSGSYNLL